MKRVADDLKVLWDLVAIRLEAVGKEEGGAARHGTLAHHP